MDLKKALSGKKEDLLALPKSFKKIGDQFQEIADRIDKGKTNEADAEVLQEHIERFKRFAKLKKLWMFRPIPLLNRIPKTFMLLAVKIDKVRLHVLAGKAGAKDSEALREEAIGFWQLSGQISAYLPKKGKKQPLPRKR